MNDGKKEKIKLAEQLYLSGMKLIDIAHKLDVPEGTMRRWKSTYKWGQDESERSVSKKANVRFVNTKKKSAKESAKTTEVEELLENAELTDKQRLFCIYYIRCFNATKAYQKAYQCDYRTAVVNASRLLTNANIKSEIQKLKQEKLNKEFLTEDDIFQKYIDIAFADITDYVEFGTEEVPVMAVYGPVMIKDKKTGEEKMLKKTVNVARFRNSAEVDGTIISEVKQGRDGASIKLADRMKALEWLTAHLDMLTEEQRAKVAVLKARVMNDEDETPADDGFLEALNGTAQEDWADEED